MKVTDKLFERVRGLWEEALEKPFVTGMADGSLEESRFRYYMLQDYIYLKEYIRLLENTKGIAESPVLREFLQIAIDSTNEETYRVHVPNMKKLGITDEEISGAGQSEFSREYTVYMTRLLEEEGVNAGLVALLHCSWLYAYIGEKMAERCPEEIACSQYKSWFDSYACREYIETNYKWIEVTDEQTEGISDEETERLCQIFETCAVFENRFWDMVFAGE